LQTEADRIHWTENGESGVAALTAGGWMRRFHWVAPKNLPSYLTWQRTIEAVEATSPWKLASWAPPGWIPIDSFFTTKVFALVEHPARKL